MNALKFYIGGEWVDPSHTETIEVINPATEEVIETISAEARKMSIGRFRPPGPLLMASLAPRGRSVLDCSRRFAKPIRSVLMI